MSEVVLSSALEAVAVHAVGAVCTRRAKLAPVGGALPRRVRIPGLPLSLQPGSLRARVASGPAGLRVLDARFAVDAELPPEADVAAELLAVEKARDALQALQARHGVVAADCARIELLSPVFPERRKGAPPRDAPVDAMLALSEFVGADLARLNAERLELERRLVDARNELELRLARLREAGTAVRARRARLQAAAVLTLDGGDASQDAELLLEYLVPGARWLPAYDLVLDRNLSSGRLRMRASVAQAGGEDWRGVRLSLSTADLQRRTDAPELRSLRIGRAQPAPKPAGWRAPPAGLDDLFGGWDSVAAHRPPARAEEKPGIDRLIEEELRSVREDEREAAPAEAAPEPTGRVWAPPPPPPSPAPAAFAAMSMPMAMPAPSPRRAKKVLARAAPAPAKYAPGGGGAPADEEMAMDLGAAAPEPPVPVGPPEPVDDLLDYERLAMAGPDERGRRGRLAPRPAGELLAAAYARVRVDVKVDVVAAVKDAVQMAELVQALPVPQQHALPRASAGSFDYRYDAAHPVDVRSNGAWHSVALFEADVEVAPAWVTVPAVEPRAYRTVVLRNRSPYALLAGPADVVVGDAFLMTVPLGTVAPGGERRVGLGVEEAIHVARNTRFEETQGGLFSGGTALAHVVEVEVANRLASPAALEVRERVPVPGDEDVKVEEKDVEPAWEPFEQAREGAHAEGARCWKIRLGAGEKKKLVAKWVVRIPASKMLVGGNRRA